MYRCIKCHFLGNRCTQSGKQTGITAGVGNKNNCKNQNLTEKPWVQCCEDAEKTPACINKWAGFCYWPIWSKEWWFWTVLPVRVVWGNTNEGTDSDLSVLVLPRYLSIILPSSLSLPPPSSGSNTSCSGLRNRNASFVPFKKINKKRINSAKRTSN